MNRITLDQNDIEWADAVAHERNAPADGTDLKNKHGCEGGLDEHILGARGELAACKCLGIEWEAKVGTFKSQADIGKRIEVRTRSRPHYELLIRSNDNKKFIWILVNALDDPKNPREFNVSGWIRGEETTKEEYIRYHGGRPMAYFVPRDKMKPMEELKQKIHANPGSLKIVDDDEPEHFGKGLLFDA